MPAVSWLGSKTPVPLAKAGLHVPPASGVPPSELNKSSGVPLAQRATAPAVPGFGLGVRVTATVAVLSAHGGVPTIVYV